MGALEKNGGDCLGGVLSMAISKVPTERGVGLPQAELKNSILYFLPQSEPNLLDGGSKGRPRQNQPSGSWEGYQGGGTTGESPDEVSCTGRGRRNHQLSQ